MQAYSMDLRERALLDSDAGMKAADVAVKYRVSGSWVRLLKQRRRETGEVAPPRRPGIRHVWFFSMKPALRTISCGGMVGPSAGPASTTTRRAPGGRPVRFSQRCG